MNPPGTVQAEILHLLAMACTNQLRKLTLSVTEIRQQVLAWDSQAVNRALADLVTAEWIVKVPHLPGNPIYRITPAGLRAAARRSP